MILELNYFKKISKIDELAIMIELLTTTKPHGHITVMQDDQIYLMIMKQYKKIPPIYIAFCYRVIV